MLRRVKDRCRVSTVVLALALFATAFLPDLIAGRQDVAGRPAPESIGASTSPESSPASFTDTTSADFSAGTPDAATYVSETADGEVILAPAFGTEFSGDSIPAGMFSTQWFPPSGVATFSGGKVTLDGVMLGTDAFYGPGRSLEFSGSIGGASLDSLGLGTNLTAAPWAVFRTGLFVFNLMTSTNDGTAQSGNVPGMVFDAFHRYRIDWTATGVSYYVDGVLVITNPNSPTVDMRPLFSNLFFGGKNNTLDWVRLTPYAAAGTFESRIFDAGGSAHWLDLVVTATMPDGTSILLETRSGDTGAPDATWSDWQALAGGSIASPNAQFIQYRAFLATSDPAITPEVQSVLINYETGCTDEICNGLDDDCDGETDEGGSTLCDDGSACTEDACIEGQCDSRPTPGAECTDGDACTRGDICDESGSCVGSPLTCDDENACTKDACVDGACVFTPTQGEACDDHDTCTTDDTCNADGRCVGSEIKCDDENACTKDACVDGQCVNTPTPGDSCDDGNTCTTDDKCNEDGRCVGIGTTCDDGNACTRDACIDGQCVYTPTPGATCDDHDACTTEDTCNSDGVCAGKSLTCDDENSCTKDACVDGACVSTPTPGETCDDHDTCTTEDTCNADGKCAGAEIRCDDENACTRDACVEGACAYTPTPGATCDDSDACTRGDACNEDGKCAGTAVVCDDENSCTKDACVGGECTFTPTPGDSCDDGNACTIDDKCNEDGRCVGVGTTCDDGNACTRDACVDGQCVYTPIPGATCDDGDACTSEDTCNADGKCVGSELKCDDENACTRDACVGGQCVYTPTPGAICDDGDACTRGDACNEDGKCAGTAVICDDENSCTKDACVGGECTFTPTPGDSCDDGNTCTIDDKCNEDGRCVGVGTTCDDGNACTRDACVDGQCVYTPTPGATCDDHDACTTEDTCNADGFCAGKPLTCDDENSCTKDACVDGACVSTPTPGETCDDHDACTSEDTCNADGKCVGSELRCDDENACTRDACVDGACVSTPAPGATCDDGNACTKDDVCNQDGRCVGSEVTCDDGNTCTKDACVGGECTFTPTPGDSCDDGNTCTIDDKCNEDGRCVGVGTTCDDGNACTRDACVDGQCVYTPTPGATCDDHDACTTEDTCNADGFCAGKPLTCDDENSCTKDACVDGACVSTPTPGETCDDHDACTSEDTCNADGKCVGSELRCDDENACTRDACVDGACVYTPTPGATCDDGDACTRGDACNEDGKCAGTAVVCDDENSCTKDACVGGECTFTPTPGDSCDDGNTCTIDDKCNEDGRCVGVGTTCDDGNACTRDACVDGQCVYTPTPGATCDDHDACTTEDTCNADGFCAGKPLTCDDENSCTKDACVDGACVSTPTPGETCDDHDACTTDDKCNEDGRCVGVGTTCDDGNACTRDACVDGQCVYTPTPGATCDNHDACTTEDTCNADGFCAGKPLTCDDENSCTKDACVDGACVSTPTPGATCDDGNACTKDDVCNQDGRCVGSEVTCDDGNTCTKDACVGGECTFTPTPGDSCDDGNTCTIDDKCNEDGRCVGVGTTCDDGNACTRDACVDGACAYTPTPGATCDDGDACTRGDTCNEDGKCAGTAVVCDDENSCTKDACVGGECAFTPTPGDACDDGNACTTEDTCNTDGRCVGIGTTCDDRNSCTRDACVDGTCVYTPTPGETCDDGDACTTEDTCSTDGKCVGSEIKCDDENACTRDACVDGRCAYTPTQGATCDDGDACTRGDACNTDGNCSGTAVVCDDENSCTKDACIGGECAFTPTPGDACDDGNACTTEDTCNTDGRCVGTGTTCDDRNSCTRDACVDGQCVYTPTQGATCDDGDACTRGDVCNADGNCSGTAVVCDDENACTRDACVNGQCVYTPTPNVTCDDGNACTSDDTCNTDGRCVGSAITCNDENACTNDSCDPTKGCVFEPNTAPCNDGNACTTNDACRQGQCAGGPPLSCDDGNACTADSCNPASGCVHDPHVTIQPVCSISPTTLNVNSQGSSFSMDLSLANICNPGAPSPIPPSAIGITHVSRAGNTIFPDPASLSCPDSGGGTQFETGLFEDLAARNVTGGSLSLKFDRASDGNCSSQDGNRQDLLAALSDVPNGTNADVCISGLAGGQVFQCCASARILNHGNR